MTLKNSSYNNFFVRQKELSKRRLWLIALTLLIYFIFSIGIPSLSLSSIKTIADRNLDPNSFSFIENSRNTLNAFIGTGSFNGIIAVILAIISAVQGFSYLDKKKQLDFYESQPVSRRRRFIDIVINSVFIFTISYLLMALIGFLIGCGYMGFNSALLISVLYQALRSISLFMAVYAVSLIAKMLAGNTVLSILGSLWLLGYEVAILSVKNLLMDIFYKTSIVDESSFKLRFSPIYNHFKGCIHSSYLFGIRNYNYSLESFIEIIKRRISVCFKDDMKNILLFIIFTLIAYFLYKRRRSESAATPIVFKIAKPILKLLTVVPISVVIGVAVKAGIFGVGINTSGLPVMIITILVSSVILSGIIESIYNMSVKYAFKRPIEMLGGFLISLFVILCFLFDFTGYDSYIPKKSDIAYGQIINNSRYFGRLIDNDGQSVHYDGFVSNYMKLSDYDALIDFAKIGIDETLAGGSDYYDDEEEHNKFSIDGKKFIESENRFIVKYKLKNGKTIKRSYIIPLNGEHIELYNKIFGSEEYKEGSEQIYHDEYIKKHSNLSKLVFGGVGENTELKLDYDKFHKAYIEDMKNMNYVYDLTHNIIGLITVSFNNNDNNDEYRYDNFSRQVSFPVYEGFNNTLDILKEEGVKNLSGNLDPSRIEKLRIYNYTALENSEMIITDRNKINMVLSASQAVNYYNHYKRFSMWSDNDSIPYSIDAYIKFPENDIYNYRYEFTDEATIPEFVKEALK